MRQQTWTFAFIAIALFACASDEPEAEPDPIREAGSATDQVDEGGVVASGERGVAGRLEAVEGRALARPVADDDPPRPGVAKRFEERFEDARVGDGADAARARIGDVRLDEDARRARRQTRKRALRLERPPEDLPRLAPPRNRDSRFHEANSRG